MALTDLKVIRIMRRRNLDRTGSELHIDILVRNDRNLFIDQRKNNRLSHQIFIALIIRMNSDGCVTEHCFRTCCRDLKRIVCPYDRITDMPEMACLLLVFDLGIGERCLALGAPVDNAFSAINITLFIQIQKNSFNCLGTAFIECEALTLPVTGCTQLLELFRDGSAVLRLPLPHFLQECLTADLALVYPLLFERIGDAHLS